MLKQCDSIVTTEPAKQIVVKMFHLGNSATCSKETKSSHVQAFDDPRAPRPGIGSNGASGVQAPPVLRKPMLPTKFSTFCIWTLGEPPLSSHFFYSGPVGAITGSLGGVICKAILPRAFVHPLPPIDWDLAEPWFSSIAVRLSRAILDLFTFLPCNARSSDFPTLPPQTQIATLGSTQTPARVSLAAAPLAHRCPFFLHIPPSRLPPAQPIQLHRHPISRQGQPTPEPAGTSCTTAQERGQH